MTCPLVYEPVYRPCKNASGSTIAIGKIVKISASPTVNLEVEVVSAVTDALYGICANAAIADGEMGDVQIGGIALVMAGDTVAVGARVTTDASADGVTATDGDSILGVAVTAGTDGELFAVELTGPGAGRSTAPAA
jgi:hypothetical protein